MLFLIALRPDPGAIEAAQGNVRLSEGLYVCRTGRSRSRLYHDIKSATRPEQLLVAPLLDWPKFKGMDPGAMKALDLLKD